MPDSGSESEARRQAILDAAARLFIRHGYDKTTMGDIAAEVGLSRGLIYLIFKNKEDVFEALLARESLRYGETWLDTIEADPRGGTIAAMYRAVLVALNSNPFMAATVKRDPHLFGSYLRKPGNLFASMETPAMMTGLLQAMQDAGAVRRDVDVASVAYIMEMLTFGLVGLGDIKPQSEIPPFDDVMESIAEMLDRMLTPEDGGNQEAGKAILRQMAAMARTHFQQMAAPDDDAAQS